MRFFYITVLLVILGGCSQTYPPKATYTLEIAPVKTEQHKSYLKDATLRVDPVSAVSIFKTKALYYRLSDNQLYAYSRSEWAQRPVELIESAILNAAETSAVFRHVEPLSTEAKSEYILKSRLNTFMQYFDTEEKKAFVVVDISFYLLDATNKKIISSQRFYEKRECVSADAKGATKSLQEALGQVVEQMSRWLQEAVQ